MNDLDRLIRQFEGTDYFEADPEPRYPYRWALFWAFLTIGSIASIALGYVSYQAAMAWMAV